jgi:group II intron reverse transcriptase/maturase
MITMNRNNSSEKDVDKIDDGSGCAATGFALPPGKIVVETPNVTGSGKPGKAPSRRNGSNNGHSHTTPGCQSDKAQSESWKTSKTQNRFQVYLASPEALKKFSEALARPPHEAKSAVPSETHQPGVSTKTWKCPPVHPLTMLPDNLMGRIANALDLAWEKELRKDGVYNESRGIISKGKQGRRKAAGPDGKSTLQAYKEYQANPGKMIQELLTDYIPSAIRRTFIPKPSGDLRPLGVPNAKDKVMQTAIVMIIGPMIEPQFADQSHGFIHYRSVYTAAEQALGHIKSGMRYVVCLDISKFFDTMDHGLLMRFFADMCPDKKLCRLIERILKSDILLVDGSRETPVRGTPQGGVVSPLLANIYLHRLDVELARRNLRFVRFADDLVIFANSLKAAKRILRSVSAYVKRDLNLEVNLEKSKPVSAYGMDFLGFTLRDRIAVSEKALEKFRETVRWMTTGKSPRQAGKNFDTLTLWMSSWFAHYGRIIDRDLMTAMNEWISELLRQRMKDGYLYASRTKRLWDQRVQAMNLGIECKSDTTKDEVF